MSAYSVVRFRPKPGQHAEFESLFRSLPRNFQGLRKFSLVRAGEDIYFSVAEWDSFDHLVAARPKMVGNLDAFRHTLEELGEGRGVTDAVSGESVIELSFAN